MKNIHVLPTDKPSRLYKNDLTNSLGFVEIPFPNGGFVSNQNIYITSDEEIKEGDWFYNIKRPDTPINRRFISTIIDENCKKIILTDHPTLVENGVQEIDDEFIEWFVKNPSCDFVMTIPDVRGLRDIFQPTGKDLYKIIIPKEEPKQFKGRGMLHYSGKIIGGEPKQENTAEYIDRHIVEAMVEVAKQKMYSEEEVEDLIYKVCGTVARLQGITLNGNHIDTAYKQFKKK